MLRRRVGRSELDADEQNAEQEQPQKQEQSGTDVGKGATRTHAVAEMQKAAEILKDIQSSQ